MTEHITDIEAELKAMEGEIYAAAKEYRTLAADAGQKRAKYDTEYAKAMLTVSHTADQSGVKMTVAEKESLSVKAVETYLTDCRIAEAHADACKQHLNALQSILSSIQTRAKLIQTERGLTARQV